MEERLQKYMAHCGIASRRKCEAMITEGRVKINGQVVTELGVKINPAKDRVLVNGKELQSEKPAYYLMHKPRGVTTTVSDDLGRKTVMDLLPKTEERLYPVGRLDRESEGLLVFTNDGQLAYYLTHPGCEVKKTYQATVDGKVEASMLASLVEKGVRVGPILVKPIDARLLKHNQKSSTIVITVAEGINREIRRVFAILGHEVKRLIRLRIGPLSLEGIRRGSVRKITRNELNRLHRGMEKADLTGAMDLLAPGKSPGTRHRRRPKLDALQGKPDPASSRKRRPAATTKKTAETAKKKARKKQTSRKKVSPPRKERPHPLKGSSK